MLDATLSYYGRIHDSSNIDDDLWASRVMEVHFFRVRERIESEAQTPKFSI